jgi:hypothetical protein
MLKHLHYGTLARFLSEERLATYVRAAAENKEKAADLYIENLNQSRILYGKLHWLEIGLRNAMNRQLSQKYGEKWFDNQHIGLNEKDISQIAKAKEQLAKENKPLSNNNVIAQLSFGFWVNLFNYPYDTLWRHCLRRTFAPHTGTLERKRVSGLLHPLLKLRNRIAHYEPIIGYDLPKMQQDMTSIVRWIEPDITELP